MRNYRADFADFKDHIWLNAASEGPLPIVAAKALQEAVYWKSVPYELTHERFAKVPAELKESIGKLINVNARDVILANSASYGIHILANGFPWQKGDEILLMQNDFPADIFPWLALEEKGVKVHQIPPKDKVITPGELLARVTSKSKLFCISQVHTFTGIKPDIERLSQICREREIIFVLNLSQSAGNMPVDLTSLPVDAAVSAGYKWLCGPYGTGFAWIKPELRHQIKLNQAYWIVASNEDDLKGDGPLKLRDIKSARKFDVFGTANFFNFVPFRASIGYWLNCGMENVVTYNNTLIDQFISGLDHSRYELISPKDGKSRSALVFLSHKNKEKNRAIYESLLQQRIHTAFWKGNIRFSPHVYNTPEEMAQIIKALLQLS